MFWRAAGAAPGQPGRWRQAAEPSRVLLRDPVPIGARSDAFDPRAIVEIPQHGGLDALIEAVRRLPAEFARELAGVDGVAAVMVLDDNDRVRAGSSSVLRTSNNSLLDATDLRHLRRFCRDLRLCHAGSKAPRDCTALVSLADEQQYSSLRLAIVCNPRGYEQEGSFKETDWKEDFLVEV